MHTVSLQNDQLAVTIALHGAELHSVKDVKSQREYLWDATPDYWGRHAPVLFPFVGSLKDKQFQYQEVSYPMSQHGFARDMEFELESESALEAWLKLLANEETIKKYPFLFALHIGYRLVNRTVEVMWKVENLDHKTMYFAIGAHPAFNCPFHNKEGKSYFVKLYGAKELNAYYIDLSCGLMKREAVSVTLDSVEDNNGLLHLTDELFARDALIIEHTEIKKVAICDPEMHEYVTVTFDAPLFGLWSPATKGAPFICIEPWYGRCDAVDFNGEISEKEYINTLQPNEKFDRSYQMTFD